MALLLLVATITGPSVGLTQAVTVDRLKGPGVGGVWTGSHGVSVWLWSGVLSSPQKRASSRAQETVPRAGRGARGLPGTGGPAAQFTKHVRLREGP